MSNSGANNHNYEQPFIDPYDKSPKRNNTPGEIVIDSSVPGSAGYTTPINFDSPYAQEFKDSKFNSKSSTSLDTQSTFYQ